MFRVHAMRMRRYAELFSPLTAPEDTALKELYTYLGVRPLSEAVTVEACPAPGAVPSASKQAMQVFYSTSMPSSIAQPCLGTAWPCFACHHLGRYCLPIA